MLSLVSNPNQLLNPAHTETIPCEYLSLETLERWIIFGFAICHSSLTQNQTANELWVLALSSGKKNVQIVPKKLSLFVPKMCQKLHQKVYVPMICPKKLS